MAERPAVRAAHTFELTAPEREAVRALLDTAFDGDFGNEDWDHALVRDTDGLLIAHGSVVQRRVLHADRSCRSTVSDSRKSE